MPPMRPIMNRARTMNSAVPWNRRLLQDGARHREAVARPVGATGPATTVSTIRNQAVSGRRFDVAWPSPDRRHADSRATGRREGAVSSQRQRSWRTPDR